MTQQPDQSSIYQQASADTQKAVEQGADIEQQVRDITLRALSQGQLDTQGIKNVIKAVIEGAAQGVDDSADHARQALSDALNGVDEALAKSTEASRLAIEEASGKVKDFSQHDLKRSLDDLQLLEELFHDTIKDVARASKQTAKQILEDLAAHAKNTGTAVGQSATDSIEKLGNSLKKNLSDVASSGSDAALKTAARISLAASGFLQGIAASLQDKTGSDKE
jgi:hypothetical protein